MVVINEWLPNPLGNDVTGEWVEIFNSGGDRVDLAGWKLITRGGKGVNLSGGINPSEYRVFERTQTKLTLHNTDGKLELYNSTGQLVDQQSFFGVAPEGSSFSRIKQGSFVFSEPTYKSENVLVLKQAIINNVYPREVVLNSQGGFFEVLGLILGVGLVLTGLIIFAIKKNEYLSDLFFRRDEEIWS